MDFVGGVQASKRRHELYNGAELNRKFSGAVKYDGNAKGMIELDAGLLKADKALKCFQVHYVIRE